MSSGSKIQHTDKSCGDMDCCRLSGVQAFDNESRCQGCNKSSSSEAVQSKDGSVSMESKGETDELGSSCDSHDDHAVHAAEKAILVSCPSKTKDSSPIQCTDDMLENCSQDKQVIKVAEEDVDLPHERLSENGSHHDYKTLQLICVADPRKEKHVSEEELKVSYKDVTEKDTSKKQLVSDREEDTQSSPLDLRPFLKWSTLPSQRQELCVSMLHSSTQVSGQFESKLPASLSPTPPIYMFELNRLSTYFSYPINLPVFAITLAGDGFIYLPEQQSVECCFCKLRLSISELAAPHADPKQLHASASPQCPLKQRGETCGNVPVKVPVTNENSNSLERSDKVSLSGLSGNSLERSDKVSLSGMSDESLGGKSIGSSVGCVRRDTSLDPSPSSQRPPAVDLATDSAPAVQQQPSSLPSRHAAETRGLQVNLPPASAADSRNAPMRSMAQLPSATVTDSAPLVQQPASQPAVNSRQPSASESKSQASSMPPRQPVSFEQNGASASASATPPRAPNKSKKSKAVKKAEAAASRKNSTTSSSSTSSSTSSASSGSSASAHSSKSSTGSTSDKSESGKEKKKLTYADLGIFADKPKRPDMASLPKRLKTYEEKWKDSYAKTCGELAECGMYYAGYADCARCFFCGGGLKNWEPQDEPWVEHARWFPKCAYLLLCKGPMFVDIVQRKNRNKEKILIKDVDAEIKQKTKRAETPLASMPVTPSDGIAGAEAGATSSQNIAGDLKKLEAEHEELTSQVTCKICMDEPSSMVFLPCGHMVACTDCAVVLKNCPLCRTDIRGTVKAQMDL